MLDITIKTIPESKQRYATCGDYQVQDGKIKLLITDMADTRSECLVAIHELIEMSLCMQMGVSFRQIDEWDLNYFKTRKDSDPMSPGDHPDCPYYYPHKTAMRIERELCSIMNMTWAEHDCRIAKATQELDRKDADLRNQ